MKYLFIFFLMCFSGALSHAGCAKVPSKDLSFAAKEEISSKSYSFLGELKKKCWYFRDIVFKNEHGQQAIVVASSKGKCIGFFRVSLANGADLFDSELTVKSLVGEAFKIDLSNGIPKSIYFDGEISNFERCIL